MGLGVWIRESYETNQVSQALAFNHARCDGASRRDHVPALRRSLREMTNNHAPPAPRRMSAFVPLGILWISTLLAFVLQPPVNHNYSLAYFGVALLLLYLSVTVPPFFIRPRIKRRTWRTVFGVLCYTMIVVNAVVLYAWWRGYRMLLGSPL